MSKLRADEFVNSDDNGAPSFPHSATVPAPTADDHFATKLYADTSASTKSSSITNTISNTAPSNPSVGDFWSDTSSQSIIYLRIWNGSSWVNIKSSLEISAGQIVTPPSISDPNGGYIPTMLTATSAVVSDATLSSSKWYKDDVEIPGATGLQYYATDTGTYKYEEIWVDTFGTQLFPSLSAVIDARAGVIDNQPTITSSNGVYSPTTLTATAAVVSNATLVGSKWYKDGVEVPGETGLSINILAHEQGIYRYEETWTDHFGTQLLPTLSASIQVFATIADPTVLTPVDRTGIDPDFDYTPESSAITDIGNQTIIDDFTGITSLTGRYEYIASDPNGSVFVTANVSAGSNYFDVSTDGGATWSTSNTVSSWASLRPYCFVDSPSYKGFIFGSVLSGMGGSAPTYKSSQGNYLSWSQAGTIPSYQSDRGRYDAFATDNTGFIVACGSYSNVAYSTNNADSWTRVSPGSGGTTTSTPHWLSTAYFAKVGKFVIGSGAQSASGNKVYLSADKTEVQSGNWTVHDSASSPPGIDDMGCNDDYLFALSGSWSGSSLWRTSDLTSWTKIADFGVTNTDKCPYNIKVKGSTVILIDSLYRGPNTGDIIVSTDNGDNWVYKKINASGDTFGSFDAAIDKDNNIVAVNDRKSPRVARTTLNANTIFTLTDTTVSKVSDGSLVETSIDQALTVGETVQADVQVNLGWITTMGNVSSNEAWDVKVDSSGNVYVVGSDSNPYSGGGVAKLNSSSEIQWSRYSHGGAWASQVLFYAVHVDGSGNVYAGGKGEPSHNALLYKYNSSGVLQWKKELNASSSYEFINGITEDSSGNIYVSAYLGGKPAVVKLNPSGNVIWSSRYDRSGQPFGVALDSSDNAYLVGDVDSKILLVKFNSSGYHAWARTLGNSQHSQRGYDVAVDSSNNIFVVGRSHYGSTYSGDYDSILAKYDTAGSLLWQRKLGNSGMDSYYDGIAIDDSDNVYLSVMNTGTTLTSVKYDNDGNIQWQNSLDTTGHNYNKNIAVDPDGTNIYMVGHCDFSGAGTEWVVAKLPGDGTGTGTYDTFTYSTSDLVDEVSTLTHTEEGWGAESFSTTVTDSTYQEADANMSTSGVRNISGTATGEVLASSGNTITLSNTSGTWSTGMKIQGVTTDLYDSPDPISPSQLSLTSSEPAVTQGSVTTWGNAQWQVAEDSGFTTNLQSLTSALTSSGTQTGPTGFTLDYNKNYYVRTKYGSSNPAGIFSNWSVASLFKTGPLPLYADDVFSTYLYTGNGSTQTIANGIDLAGEGGMVWIKNRDKGGSPMAWASNYLFDTARNPDNSGSMQYLITNQSGTSGGTNSDTTKDFGGWASDGFLLGEPYSMGADALNGSGDDFVSWTFRKAPGFFDVVTWTGTNDGTRIPHNLGSLPGMIIVKNLDSSVDWKVYAKKEMWIDGETYAYYRLSLNNTNQSSETVANIANTDTFNPQSMGSEASGTNYIAYLFADDDARFGANGDESIIKCGTYVGDGQLDGPTIDLGWEPQWLMVKNATYTSYNENWTMLDVMREWNMSHSKGAYSWMSANQTNPESRNAAYRINSRGFQPSDNGAGNISGQTYIYMAIRRPHKPATIATDVFKSVIQSTHPQTIDVGFPVDLHINKNLDNPGHNYWVPRITNQYLISDVSNAEGDGSSFQFDLQDEFSYGTWWGSDTIINYYFKRSPGFMDVVDYTGTGSNQTVSHNLGAVPELIILKKRNNSNYWHVFADSVISPNSDWYQNFGTLNTDSHFASFTGAFTGAPTSTTLPITGGPNVGASNDTYIAYLFASQPGISKVGVYSGTGSNIDVDCGFAAGARFVMIKRTDGSGDWYYWDTTRGIVSGNDPYLRWNHANASVTNTDYIDPLNAGFTVTSSAPADINASGGEYLFLAIA